MKINDYLFEFSPQSIHPIDILFCRVREFMDLQEAFRQLVILRPDVHSLRMESKAESQKLSISMDNFISFQVGQKAFIGFGKISEIGYFLGI